MQPASPAEPDTCVLCQTVLLGPYCHACGSPRQLDRFTLPLLWQQTLQNVFDLHKGLLHTIITLTTAPGPTIRHYLTGSERYLQYNPVKYFLLTFALIVTLANVLELPSPLADLEAVMPKWFSLIESLVLLAFLLAYAISFVFSVRLVRKVIYNVSEVLIYIFYTTGHFNWFYMLIFFPIAYWAPQQFRLLNYTLAPALFVCFQCYTAYGFLSKFKGRTIELILGANFRLAFLVPLVLAIVLPMLWVLSFLTLLVFGINIAK